jgi:phosphoglycolate phosphatase-like HAD superfamily hydrolase
MILVLFDIDGTLIYCDRVGRKSLDRAIKQIFQTKGIPSNYSLSGKTDKQIIYDILKTEKFHEEEINSKIDQVFIEYCKILKSNIKSAELNRKIMPGIIPLLNSLLEMKDIIGLGLVTGNLKESALLKLELFDLHKYFMIDGELFGGFGSDHIDRSKIVEIAVERANRFFGYDFKEKEIVIIGDSNNDILCGKHLNVKSIAVSTGEWSFEDLKKFEPDYLFHDFSDYEKVIDIIMT